MSSLYEEAMLLEMCSSLSCAPFGHVLSVLRLDYRLRSSTGGLRWQYPQGLRTFGVGATFLGPAMIGGSTLMLKQESEVMKALDSDLYNA